MLLGIAFVAMALILIFRSLHPLPWNQADDSKAYAVFPKLFLETGTLIDPFNFRRLVTYGGYSYLHSFFLSFLSSSELHLLDLGVGTILLAWGIFETLKGRAAAVLGFLPLLLVAPRINLGPCSITAFLFLTLVRSLPYGILPTGLALAGLGTIRSDCLVLGVVLVTLHHVKRPRELFYVAAVAFLCLSPWMALLYQSSGTILYPLFPGNYHLSAPLSGVPFADLPGKVLPYAHLPLLAAILAGTYFFAGITLPVIAGLASLATGLGTVYAFSLSDADNLFRYYYPYALVSLILVSAGIVDKLASLLHTPPRWGYRSGILATYLVWCVWGETCSLVQSGVAHERPTPAYSKFQERVPPSARLLTLVEDPHFLDYERQWVRNLDIVGLVSPAPGWPAGENHRALETYFKSIGVTHLLYVRPERSSGLYNRNSWEGWLNRDNPLWKAHAQLYLSFFDQLDHLKGKRLLEDEDHVLIELSDEA